VIRDKILSYIYHRGAEYVRNHSRKIVGGKNKFSEILAVINDNILEENND
jgi:hypothetical protein